MFYLEISKHQNNILHKACHLLLILDFSTNNKHKSDYCVISSPRPYITLCCLSSNHYR
jgi:hypothetical protein